MIENLDCYLEALEQYLQSFKLNSTLEQKEDIFKKGMKIYYFGRATLELAMSNNSYVKIISLIRMRIAINNISTCIHPVIQNGDSEEIEQIAEIIDMIDLIRTGMSELKELNEQEQSQELN